jgi:hypothetical protein
VRAGQQSASVSVRKVSPMRHPIYGRDPGHQGCVICAQYHAVTAARHRLNVAKIHRVAASLQRSESRVLLGGKQETPGPGSPKVSTLISAASDRRAAGVQSGTGPSQ